MTPMEYIAREKSDKRASETRRQARIVSEEIIARRKRFFRQAASDQELMQLAKVYAQRIQTGEYK
jgi:hypothetical protein